MNDQIKSKGRVRDHGEVFTREHEVTAMLDLVLDETERIDSRFLEPACGNGNFLTEILLRKLQIVVKRYAKSQYDFDRNLFIAVSSIYGIELLEENATECRSRLRTIVADSYLKVQSCDLSPELRRSLSYVLERNIVVGDALTLRTPEPESKPIVFSEWSAVNGSKVKRRDFSFHELLSHGEIRKLPLFSDLGEDVFIPTPEKEYPLTHYLEVHNAK